MLRTAGQVVKDPENKERTHVLVCQFLSKNIWLYCVKS